MVLFEGCPAGWGAYPPKTKGLDSRGRGQEPPTHRAGLMDGGSGRRGKGSGGVQGLRFRGGRW